MKRAIVSLVPVPHAGYLAFFRRNPFADILIITPQFVQSLDKEMGEKLLRDLHLIHPSTVIKMIRPLILPSRIISTFNSLDQLKEYGEIIMPDEDVSRLIEKQCPEKVISWDTWFLRFDWTKATVQKTVVADEEMTSEEFHKVLMRSALQHGGLSSDWWRQIGAIAVRDGDEILRSFNEHLPTNDVPYVQGDIRSNLNAGQMPEICTAHHAEVGIIAVAAGEGIPLKGCDLYISTFPCPRCVRSIIKAKIKTIYFSEGYSTLDGRELLEKSGIKVVKVLL